MKDSDGWKGETRRIDADMVREARPGTATGLSNLYKLRQTNLHIERVIKDDEPNWTSNTGQKTSDSRSQQNFLPRHYVASRRSRSIASLHGLVSKRIRPASLTLIRLFTDLGRLEGTWGHSHPVNYPPQVS